MKWLHRNLLRFKFYQIWVEKTKSIPLRFMGSFNLYEFLAEFFKEVERDNIFIKSSALAFQFLLAIFPGIIFLFTLLAFIPIPDFQENIMGIFREILPGNVFAAAEDTLKEVVIKKNGGLLSFGFIASLYFSTSGMATLIRSFHKNNQRPDTRTYFAKRLLALFLTGGLTLLLFLAAITILTGQYIIHVFLLKHFIQSGLESFIIWILQLMMVATLFYIGIALIYYFGPRKRPSKKFFTIGAGMASFASLITTEGFAFYVSHFSNYNKIYGSIGTLIVVMGLLYLNSSILLIGYDIELSIYACRRLYGMETRKSPMQNPKIAIQPKRNHSNTLKNRLKD